MANALYGKGREGFLGATIDWDGNIKVLLYDASQTPSIDVDYLCDKDTIPDVDRVTNGLSGNLANATKTLGVANADDITLATVSGNEVVGFVIALDGGGGCVEQTTTTDFLIADIDTATGLPITPNGGNITIAWSEAAEKIFKL